MKSCPRCAEIYADELTHCSRDGDVLRAVRDPMVGQTIGGRYRIVSRLGKGGMSSVYFARHVMIDRLLAIKILRRDLSEDPVQRDRFLREARAANRINHENIVEITDFGETEDGLVYLVMEYVPGDSLLELLQREGPMSGLRALDIIEQITTALARAHEMGIIHRDLKPENIVVVQRKQRADFVKVLDFGIAKFLDAPSLTRTQQIFGTPGYIAPEYIQSSNFDARADLYSLGCILYELVTGALPFDYEYPGDLLLKHVSEAPIPPSERLPTIEAPLEALVLRLLQKHPADRFRDAHQLIEEIRRVRERLGPAGSWGSMSELAEEIGEATIEVSDAEMRIGIEDESSAEVTQSFERSPVEEARVGTLADGIPASLVAALNAERDSTERALRDGAEGLAFWRARIDAVRGGLSRLSVRRAIPDHVERAMASALSSYAALDARVGEAHAVETKSEALRAEVRALRVRLGRAIDEVARKLSLHRGELERLSQKRVALRDRRDSAMRDRRSTPRSDVSASGESDALMWELAALELEMTKEATRCDELELRRSSLLEELEAQSQAHDGELDVFARELARAVGAIAPLTAALEAPLEEIDAFLEQHAQGRT